MIDVQQAVDCIQQKELNLGTKMVPLDDSIGEYLGQDIVADRDLPPFDRVCMDGFAIDFESWEQGQLRYVIQEYQKAGDSQKSLEKKSHCIDVSTGTTLPNGCNCVIKVEDVLCEDNMMIIPSELILKKNQNIHPRGSDYPQNQILLKEKKQIFAPEVGILATVGHDPVKILRKPMINIISTGNELVDVCETPLPTQIRASNKSVIKAGLTANGFKNVQTFHLIDSLEIMSRSIKDILEVSDIVILSGGVSAGKFDFVPKALEANGVIESFHKIKQRPGKPMWYGTKEDKIVFGLPGNPVSATICLYRYIIPYLSQQLGLPEEHQDLVKLLEPIEFEPSLTLFKLVRITNKDGNLWATPVKVNGSGDLASITLSDGFVECDANQTVFPKGSHMKVYRWKN